MAFKQICTSLLVAVACCSVLSMAQQLSYLRETDQNGSPFQNQGSFTYLRDNGANPVQSVYPIQSGPVNYFNNIGNPQIQTIASYPNAISSVGFVGNNYGFGSNIVNNVNSLSAVEYPVVAQNFPVYNQVVSYPSVQPVAQYAVQPAFIGGPAGYSNNNNQVTNTQVSPVEINFGNQQPNYINNYPRPNCF